MELGRVVGISGGQHSGGSGGGFREGSGLIQNGDAGAAVVEFEREGEANDACPRDADVGIRKLRVLHVISLERDQSRRSLPLNYNKREHRGTCLIKAQRYRAFAGPRRASRGLNTTVTVFQGRVRGDCSR